MHKYELWLDGVSCEDVGIRLQGALQLSAPVLKVTTVSVPGRNGDLHFFDGSFKNRTATVNAYTYSPERVKSKFGLINEWLVMPQSYRRIETDDDREHFMLGRVSNGADVAARLDKIAPFTLKFDCKPQRFLKSGEETVVFNESGILVNPTGYSSLPMYKIQIAGSGSVSVDTYSLEITNYNGSLFYDAETQNAYTTGVNLNNRIKCAENLPFDSGEHNVTLTGSVTQVEIIPRWWEL